MRTVIGEYSSQKEAEGAVRALEADISLQTIAIRDQRGHKWRMRDRKRNRSLDAQQQANFVVTMSGTPQNIERARSLLLTGAAERSSIPP